MAASRLSLLMLGAALGPPRTRPTRPGLPRAGRLGSRLPARALCGAKSTWPRRPSIRAWPGPNGRRCSPRRPRPAMDRRQCRTGAAGRRCGHARDRRTGPDVVLRCAPVAQAGILCPAMRPNAPSPTAGRWRWARTGSWDGGAHAAVRRALRAPALLGRTRRHAQGTSDGAAARSARDEPRRGRRGRPARRIRVLSRPVPARIWRSARTGFASRRRPHVVRAKPATRCHLRGARAGLSDRCRPAGARAGRLRRHPAP